MLEDRVEQGLIDRDQPEPSYWIITDTGHALFNRGNPSRQAAYNVVDLYKRNLVRNGLGVRPIGVVRAWPK